MLILECETAGAGLADLRRRTNWQAWEGSQLQERGFNWRLRVDNATRSLDCLVQIDPDGQTYCPHLWDTSETVPLPGRPRCVRRMTFPGSSCAGS
ncbi:hypothetical protein OOK27_22610 [Streptomyces canus]|uniref:hypothetical protein n=1 Tax=Streptomyces canus TaxID=58343 RepID=UPI00224E5CDA|nr:hypothetical protein [Streptomyces canus]MCX5256887.1 hypothetical protein [Streptomyces canus]